MALSLAVFVIHQLSYAENVALAGQLSESIKIVNRCTPEALGPLNTFHPIIDTEILNIVHQLCEDSLVVTHPTTNSPACGLSTAERTGSPVFHTLWSYVLGVTLGRLIKRKSPLLKWVLYEAKWRAGVAPDIPPIHTGLLVYGADDVDGGVQKIHLDIWHSTRQHRAHIRKVCGRVIGHAAGRTWHGVDGQALNYIADHAQIGTLLGGAACVFTTLGIIYAVRRYHSIIAIK
ncbi:hypothetical protein N7472_010683 [Penicillium cf. griseofulvum]|uniref:Uncharacterized protein n=1 Tax=Penicillium cf. griseofulvum TaxID=2972120 RepID=A0A9W9M1T7_9EURO|nr:hypothetical protein N7472_010683 [Penicillium cf. griseofulvum]